MADKRRYWVAIHEKSTLIRHTGQLKNLYFWVETTYSEMELNRGSSTSASWSRGPSSSLQIACWNCLEGDYGKGGSSSKDLSDEFEEGQTYVSEVGIDWILSQHMLLANKSRQGSAKPRQPHQSPTTPTHIRSISQPTVANLEYTINWVSHESLSAFSLLHPALNWVVCGIMVIQQVCGSQIMGCKFESDVFKQIAKHIRKSETLNILDFECAGPGVNSSIWEFVAQILDHPIDFHGSTSLKGWICQGRESQAFLKFNSAVNYE